MDEINAWKSIYVCIGFTRKKKDRSAYILVYMYYTKRWDKWEKVFHLSSCFGPTNPLIWLCLSQGRINHHLNICITAMPSPCAISILLLPLCDIRWAQQSHSNSFLDIFHHSIPAAQILTASRS